MFSSRQWIDSQGATLETMAEHNLLWVTEQRPPDGKSGRMVFVVEADEKDRMVDLMKKWLGGTGSEIPRSHFEIERQFMSMLSGWNNTALIVENAHVLRGAVLEKFRLFSEKRILVVLVGDVSRISVAMDDFPGFFQRASYCIKAARIFLT